MKKDVKSDKNKVKKEIIESGQIVFENRLVIGPGGDISYRTGDLFYITPSGKGVTMSQFVLRN
jgi:ribulose-5-phosphate 4-epimerase/fuculose-1-phosphate aldolase